MARIVFIASTRLTLKNLGFTVPEEMDAQDFFAALHSLTSASIEDDDDAEGEPGEAEDVAGEPEDGQVEGEPLPSEKKKGKGRKAKA